MNNKVVVVVLFLLYFLSGVSQNSSINEEYSLIKWVSQYPDSQVKKTKSFFKLFFGKEENFKIIKPNAILKINSGSYFVLDQGNNTIIKIKDNKRKIPKAIKKSKFDFLSLVDFCVFSNNQILFTDSKLNKIFKYSEEKNELVIFNNNIMLNRPTGIAFSFVTKEIWIIETGSHRISVLNENGDLIKTIGKRGLEKGEFNFPTSIWIDKSGKIYIVDSLNFRIQVFDQYGKVISVFGESGNATGYFGRPKGIATDSHGNIYVCDALFHTVQIFSISGNFLYQFGRQGRKKNQFWMPTGIYIDEDDKIYIADSYNSRIQMFKLVVKVK